MVDSNNFQTWVRAARPQTLSAAFVPVLIGATLAAKETTIDWSITLPALLCAFLIQIGTNFANDYFDYKKGADTDDRIGFERATATGRVTEQQMLSATIGTMGMAFLCGLYIVWQTNWIVLIIGIACLVFGILYTGGPYPLGYNGLGDLFVFIFFGIVAVMTTYYVNSLAWSQASFWASLTVGALATNILVINNLRDSEQDRRAGKNTLGVLFGDNALRMEYLLMLGIAYAIPPHFYFRLDYTVIIFLPFLVFPFAIALIYKTWIVAKPELNKTLEQTAQFMTIFCILFSIGIYYG